MAGHAAARQLRIVRETDPLPEPPKPLDALSPTRRALVGRHFKMPLQATALLYVLADLADEKGVYDQGFKLLAVVLGLDRDDNKPATAAARKTLSKWIALLTERGLVVKLDAKNGVAGSHSGQNARYRVTM